MDTEVLETGNSDALPQPLRWSMHGGPGTGETHVIKTIKDYVLKRY